MIKTYCGKECEQCMTRRLHECDGCTDENGKKKSEKCVIAQCCEEKQYGTCVSCGKRKKCVTYHYVMTPLASMLGTWISVLFWLIVPSIVATVLTSESVVNIVPEVEVPGTILKVVIAVAYGVILLKMSSAHYRYKLAGISRFILQVISIVVLFIDAGSGWIVAIALIFEVISLFSEYNEIEAHSKVLEDIDDELASSWCWLWYANLAMDAGIVGGLLIAFISPKLGALILLAASICAIVVSVLKLVYLYRTAEVFKKIGAN